MFMQTELMLVEVNSDLPVPVDCTRLALC